MIDAPIARMPPAIAQDFARAMADWQGAMSNRMDFPETHLVLGGVALTMRNAPAAAAAFREATRLDPQSPDAWVMLVRIAAAVEGPEAARRVLSEALGRIPDDPTLRSFEADLAP